MRSRKAPAEGARLAAVIIVERSLSAAGFRAGDDFPFLCRTHPVGELVSARGAALRQQIELLSARYTILSLREVVDRLERNAPLPRSTAVVTFDDGFRNVLTTAHPVLEKHGVPATVFLVTGAVGTRQPAWPDLRLHAFATTTARYVDFEEVRWELGGLTERLAGHRAIKERLKTLDDDRRRAACATLMEPLAAPPVRDDSPLAALDWPEIEQLARACSRADRRRPPNVCAIWDQMRSRAAA